MNIESSQTKTYKIITAEDGTHWMPLEPMIDDITKEYSTAQKNQVSAEILERIYLVKTFLDALLQEGKTNDREGGRLQ